MIFTYDSFRDFLFNRYMNIGDINRVLKLLELFEPYVTEFTLQDACNILDKGFNSKLYQNARLSSDKIMRDEKLLKFLNLLK